MNIFVNFRRSHLQVFSFDLVVAMYVELAADLSEFSYAMFIFYLNAPLIIYGRCKCSALSKPNLGICARLGQSVAEKNILFCC